MPTYSFRLRFFRSPIDTVNIDEPHWEWRLGEDLPSLILCVGDKVTPIKEANELIFKSDGWTSEEAAAQAETQYVDVLMLTLARLRVGVDFGSRAPKSAFTLAGLAMLEAQTGCRVLNDVHGPMVFETDPPPRFALFSADALRGVKKDHFETIFERALCSPRSFSDRERLSFELFNASFFQKSADTRFIMLVMSIEALIEPEHRSIEATAHVDSLIEATKKSSSITDKDRRSILGSLRWLRYESINQAGKRLAQEQLGERLYDGKSASSFFSNCYNLRSRLVHGEHPPPTQQEIGSASAQLEVFVSDLLTGDLREIELN